MWKWSKLPNCLWIYWITLEMCLCLLQDTYAVFHHFCFKIKMCLLLEFLTLISILIIKTDNVSVLVCVLGLAATVGALPKLTSIVSRWHAGSDRYSGPYSCPNCSRVYQHRPSLSQHLKHECGKEPQFQCPFCPQRTTQKGSLRKHMRRRHNLESHSQYLWTQRCTERFIWGYGMLQLHDPVTQIFSKLI